MSTESDLLQTFCSSAPPVAIVPTCYGTPPLTPLQQDLYRQNALLSPLIQTEHSLAALQQSHKLEGQTDVGD